MLLVKSGRVKTPGGEMQHCDVLCENGRIRQIGPALDAPGAAVIDASGLDVYPGLVLPICAVGAMGFADNVRDKDEKTSPLTPQMDIRHAFDLRELKRQRFGRVGITSYGLSPGLSNLLSGQMSFIHVDGERTSDVYIRERIALKGNFVKEVKATYASAQKAPMTRMAMYQMLDEAFRAAQEYGDKTGDKSHDAGNEVILRALRREIPFVVNAYTLSETESVIELGEKYNLDLVIAGGFAAHKCADQIIARGWHVSLGDATFFMAGLEGGCDHKRLVELYRGGLKLSLGCSGDEGYPPGYEQLLWTAALMRRAGATADEIMDMITINPARALRVDDAVGSIETGKYADLIVTRGNPCDRFDSHVLHTVVAGRHFYAREGR